MIKQRMSKEASKKEARKSLDKYNGRKPRTGKGLTHMTNIERLAEYIVSKDRHGIAEAILTKATEEIKNGNGSLPKLIEQVKYSARG